MKFLQFWLLVFALSLPIWAISTRVKVAGLPLDVPVTDFALTFIPAIAACILVGKSEGVFGVKRLLKRVFDFSRIGRKIWYFPMLLLMPAIYLAIYGALRLFGLPLPSGIELPFSLMLMPIFAIVVFVGTAGEELGYMGYAIDPTQEQWGALKTAVVMGLLWAIWHYPSILQQGHGLTWIAWGTLGTVAVRVLIVWLYNNTGRSVFACIMFHSIANIGRIFFPKDQIHNPLVDYPGVHYSTIALAALVVIFLWGAKTLARYRYA